MSIDSEDFERRLDPSLFPETSVNSGRGLSDSTDLNASQMRSAAPSRRLDPGIFGESPTAGYDWAVEDSSRRLADLEGLFGQMREEQKELRRVVQKLSSQLNTFRKEAQAHLKQAHNRAERLERDLRDGYARMNQKVTDAQEKSMQAGRQEKSVRNMVERHNQVISQFEAKIQQMGRMLKAREAQLVSARGTIDDLQMQLKRRS